MKVCLVKYPAGNVKSVEIALKRLGITPVLTSDPDTLNKADKLILPGVGHAGELSRFLEAENLAELIRGFKNPVLGICLGMQIMCSASEEGNARGLGIVDGNVLKFKGELKVPQIGWNRIYNLKGPLFKNVTESAYVYYVNSFYLPVVNCTSGFSHYGTEFSAAVERDNFFGVQFHPEKSGPEGYRIITNFLSL
jgi:imidazole glycerol-phosphate synthase subunit HisH